MPFETVLHAESSKFNCVQASPRLPSVGTKIRTALPAPIRFVTLDSRPMPYDRFAYCNGYAGANALAAVTPSGITSARYSPPELSLKLVCNSAPFVARFLADAKTTRYPSGGKFVAGKVHLTKFVT